MDNTIFQQSFKYIYISVLWEGSLDVNHFNIKLLNTLETYSRKLDEKKWSIQAITRSVKHWDRLQQHKRKKLCWGIKMPSYKVKTRFKNQTKMTLSLCPALLWLLICISIQPLNSSSPVCNGKQKRYPVLSQHSAITVCCVRTQRAFLRHPLTPDR